MKRVLRIDRKILYLSLFQDSLLLRRLHRRLHRGKILIKMYLKIINCKYIYN